MTPFCCLVPVRTPVTRQQHTSVIINKENKKEKKDDFAITNTNKVGVCDKEEGKSTSETRNESKQILLLERVQMLSVSNNCLDFLLLTGRFKFTKR